MRLTTLIIGLGLVAAILTAVNSAIGSPEEAAKHETAAARVAVSKLQPGLARMDAERQMRAMGYELVYSRNGQDGYRQTRTYFDFFQQSRRPVTVVLGMDGDGKLRDYIFQQ